MSLQVILLDIEGTTTPISFVYDKLFPYARNHIRTWLTDYYRDPVVQEAIICLERENATDIGHGAPQFNLNGNGRESPDAVADYCLWLMDRDRKTTPLKTIQGLIWQDGFKRGDLQSEVFPDVPVSFSEWHRKGHRVAIYSSGSVTAQRLVFEHTPYGNLLPLIDAFFYTRIGPKQDVKSYSSIVNAMGVEACQMLFVSDVCAELEAAAHAGLSVALSVRPGNSIQTNLSEYCVVYSLAELKV